MESSSFSGSSKRAKAPGNITQVPQCLVDGCDADLSLCRDYHRRHKVCETHSKTPKVTIGGREQRFCQQCSRPNSIPKGEEDCLTLIRFHSLVEFDEGKRSCRKRLDGHNRRRRKPQPNALRRNPISNFSNQGGGTRQLLSFSSSHIPPNAIVGFSWALGNRAHNNEIVGPHVDYQQHQQLNSSSLGETASSLGQQIQLLDPNATAMGSDYCGGQRNMIFLDGLNSNNRVVDCDRALSLLSSSAATPLPTSLVNGLQYYNHDGFVAHEERSKDIHSSHGVGGGGAATTLHFPEMFQPGQEGSLAGASHQTLTFMWE